MSSSSGAGAAATASGGGSGPSASGAAAGGPGGSSSAAAAAVSRFRRRRPDGPIRFKTSFRNTIYEVLKSRPGWVEAASSSASDDGGGGSGGGASAGDWDFQWAERDWVYDTFDSAHLDGWQRMNHFRNGRELCRKDNLAKNVKRVRRALEKEGKGEEAAAAYGFTPITFVLPGDYALFVEEFKKPSHAGATWIMKPVGRSQGKGIFLFSKLTQIQQWRSDYRWKPENAAVESYVVQRYLADPYLVGGKKFDLRVYALVTSFNPLTVWVYRAGFARFTSSRYSTDSADLENAYVHLTNVAVQKTSADYNADLGGKWSLQKLKAFLTCRDGLAATDRLFAEVQAIMLRSLLAVQKMIIADHHCFELYGYDILIDASLRPWLIEVNASPSMTASTPDDHALKFKLLNDVLDIVDMEGRLVSSGNAAPGTPQASGALPPEDQVGGFDCVWRNDAPVPPQWEGAPSLQLPRPAVISGPNNGNELPPGVIAAAVAASPAATTTTAAAAAGGGAGGGAGAAAKAGAGTAAGGGRKAAGPSATAAAASELPEAADGSAASPADDPAHLVSLGMGINSSLSLYRCMMGADFDPRVNVYGGVVALSAASAAASASAGAGGAVAAPAAPAAGASAPATPAAGAGAAAAAAAAAAASGAGGR